MWPENANDWHYVTISDNGTGQLKWSNAAGAEWGLEFSAADNTVTTMEDCPYGVVELTILEDGTLTNTGEEGAFKEPYTPVSQVNYEP